MLRNLFLLLACICIVGTYKTATAQVFVNESFDGTTFVPTGWTKNKPGSLDWLRYTSTTHPSGNNPHSGAGMAGLNSWSVSSGTCDIATPSFDLTTATGIREISFWMFRDNGYLGYNEGVRVYINTSTSVSGATLLGTINRAIDMPPVVTTTGWYQYIFTIPASYTGANNYVIFQGFSTYGNDCYIDDVMVYNYTPCNTPSGIAASNITSGSATLSWNAIAGSLGYEYVINQAAGTPATTPTPVATNSFSETGLTPNTSYYLHVRNRCAAGSAPGALSPWVDYQFKTHPPCYAPGGFNVTQLQPTSATVNWAAYPSAVNYDVIVDQQAGDPVSTTGMQNTTGTSYPVSGLTENTKYYVHLRSNCYGNEQSGWGLDSFTTPVVCRQPTITIDNINTDRAVASWNHVPTAVHYEYAVSTQSTPPAEGTAIAKNNLLLSALLDGKVYYIHVRSACVSLGIPGISDWATATFKTFPTGVQQLNGEHFTISIFPNPVADQLTVKLEGQNGTAALQLMDVNGKTVRTIHAVSGNTEIDMQGLPAGIYTLQYTDLARHEVVKVVKQ